MCYWYLHTTVHKMKPREAWLPKSSARKRRGQYDCTALAADAYLWSALGQELPEGQDPFVFVTLISIIMPKPGL